MAFIDDFNKLVVTKGQQQKVTDKDKAIIDLANEVANGGGSSETLPEIKSIWKKVGSDYEKLDILHSDQFSNYYDLTFTEGTEKYYLSASETEKPIGANYICLIGVENIQLVFGYLPSIKNMLRTIYFPTPTQDGIISSISVFGESAYDFKFAINLRIVEEQ